MKIELKCKHCKKPYKVIPSVAKKGSTYCSVQCRGKAKTAASTVDYPCNNCSKLIKRTKTEIKRGKKYCDRDCYLAAKQKELDAKAERICVKDGCDRSNIIGRGLCSRCYQFWLARFGKSAVWKTKTCPTCETEFPTHRDRKFCSRDCYVKSDIFQAARDAFSKKAEECRVKGVCLNCEKEISVIQSQAIKQKYADGVRRSPKRFCKRRCYREWFSKRFDEQVADYKKLELTMSYDEFLCQSELPCPIEDCDWAGKNLSIHVNLSHNIKAEDFKALLGFNRSTSLITNDLREYFKENTTYNDGMTPLTSEAAREYNLGVPKLPIRAEGREHLSKAMILSHSIRKMKESSEDLNK